jgi:hypothetical protein
MSSESAELFQVRVVSSSTSRISCGPCYLEDIIKETEYDENFMIEAPSGAYILLLTEIQAGHSPWSANDALQFCTNSIQQTSSSVVCFFRVDSMPESGTYKTRAISMLSIFDPAAKSVGNWPVMSSTKKPTKKQQQPFAWLLYKKQTRARSLWQHRSKLIWLGLAVLLLVVVLASAAVLRTPPSRKYWQRYDTRGSKGPRYQLQFNHHNVSTWSAIYPEPNEAWFLRIDDQAMVPPSTVDDDELRYQRWFQQRYPEADRVRLSGDYLNEAFLSDPSAIQVPADEAFHMAHCVLAVRRYWLARETGRHVCPRDIDYNHMKHCMDALDIWAFPEGLRGSIPQTMSGAHHGSHAAPKDDTVKVISDETRLVWRTKVCFD